MPTLDGKPWVLQGFGPDSRSRTAALLSVFTWLAVGLFGGLARAQQPTGETVQIPMRDGVVLTATVWLPREPGPHPVILIRSPYPRTCCKIPTLAAFYVEHGYAVVSQDVRGRGDSGGRFGFWFQEVNDGYDSVEWLARQEWSSGRVGMMGASYPGLAQWLAARARPTHLVCLVPISAGGDYFRDFPYMGGAFVYWQALTWVASMTSGPAPSTAATHEIDVPAMVKWHVWGQSCFVGLLVVG